MSEIDMQSAAVEEEIIKDQQAAKILREDGVVKIPFLTAEELEKAVAFQKAIHGEEDPPSMINGIHMTIWDSHLPYKLSVNYNLKELMKKACDRAFGQCRDLSHQFLIKKKGPDTTFNIHQDWSIVNEKEHVSFNIWIPLQDVDENNGAMWIIKRSHLMNRMVRGAGYLFPNYLNIFDELKPYMTSYPMKAGEALLFYHRTIHGSPANLGGNGSRVVVQMAVIPQEAPMEIYFQPSENEPLEIHNPVDNFNFHYDRITEESQTKPPSNSPTEVRSPIKVDDVTLEEVLEAIK